MNDPVESSNTPALRALPQESLAGKTNHSESFDGGGGEPPSKRKSSAGYWMLFGFGAILMMLSGFALSKDPAAATYYQHFSWLGGLRVNIEQAILVIGGACSFTALAILREHSIAKRIEQGSEGKIKSFRARRLEKLSDYDIFTVIAKYIGSFLR